MTTHIIYAIGVFAPIIPSEPLPPLPNIPHVSLVIVEDNAPIWQYGMVLYLLHSSPIAAIASHDMCLGAKVVVGCNLALAKRNAIDVKLPTT
jgi:hypothetical protein